MARLRELEEANSPQLDRAADAFAKILACSAQAVSRERTRRVLEQLLYHLGRWVYLMDAWDDLDEDKKKGRYNPLDARFQGQARENREYLETTAAHSQRLTGAAAELLEPGEWTPIVENILYIGLPAVQSAVLDGRWKEMRDTRRKPHERSLRGAGREP